VLGLGGRLDRPAQHLLDRVEVLGPRTRAPHEVTDQVDGQLGPVEERARPGATNPRLGRRFGDPSAQRFVPAQLGAGVARGVDRLADPLKIQQGQDSSASIGHEPQRMPSARLLE
jgi:hypothetical protein